MKKTPQELESRFIGLVRQGVNPREASRVAGISPRTGARILDRVDGGPQIGLPFSGAAQPPPVTPQPGWSSDQPSPPPPRDFDPRYHGHAFKNYAAPIAFEGWTLERVRTALALHRMGNFLESSTLALVCLGFAPVMAALSQRMAPALALPRHIRSGNRGLSRVLGEEVEAQISPRAGLYPSDVFPATLYGATQFDSAMMGFSVWQHVFGEPDQDTGIRALYTRRWPTWAVQYYRYRRTYVALTDAGPIDILNDGKFTLIADTDEPHFFGAILALAEEALDGVSTRNARASYIDRYGNPKLIATMPQSVGSNSPEGQAMMDALYTLRGPDGFSVVPFGAKIDFVSLAASQSTVMNDAMTSNWQNIAATLLGSDGTMTRGTGVYSAPIFAGVRRDLVDRDLRVLVRGINQGHIGTWLKYNYAASIEANRGEWIQPVIDIPLPDPDADARVKSYADRLKSFHEIIEKEKAAGYLVTQERSDQIAASLEIEPPRLADVDEVVARLELAPTDIAKVVRVREVRASQGLPPLGDERDDLTVSEMDAMSKSQPAEPGQEPVGAPGEAAPESDTPIEATEGASSEPAENTNGAADSSGGETKTGSANSASATDMINHITVEAGGHLTIIRAEEDFDENKHPRAPDGKFGSGPGGGGDDKDDDDKDDDDKDDDDKDDDDKDDDDKDDDDKDDDDKDDDDKDDGSDGDKWKDSPNDTDVNGEEIDTESDYGRWDDRSDEPQTITLHRAAKDDYVDQGYSFAEDRDTAEVYQENQGFGGANLYHCSLTLSVEQIQDYRGKTAAEVAEELGFEDPGAIGLDEWLPRNPRALDALQERGFKFARVDESFPEDTTTWIWCGDSSEDPELNETSGDLKKKTVKKNS